MNDQLCKNCNYFIRKHLNFTDPWGICNWPNEMMTKPNNTKLHYCWETTEAYGQNCPCFDDYSPVKT